MMLKPSDSLSDPFPFRNLDLCWLTDLFQLVNNIPQASPLNCSIIIRCAEKTASANASEMTISSRVDPEYPLYRAFSHSIGGQHESFG